MHPRHFVPTSSEPALAPFDALLLHWLGIGALVLALLPAAQWHNLWIGWLPYWLVLVPALLLVRRVPLVAGATRMSWR